MKINFYKCLVVILLLAFVIAACSPTAASTGNSDQSSSAENNTASEENTSAGSEDPQSESVTVTWATLAGFYTDWAKSLAADFTAETGINVEIVEMDLTTMYEKEVLDIVGGTGAYDIITWNVSWKSEWANNEYIYPLDDFIARDADEVQIDDVSQALLNVSVCGKGRPTVCHITPLPPA